jgi:hypothetical protein
MARETSELKRLADLLSSMRLTQVCLGLLMVLVVACTLLQVPLGTHLAVERTIRSFMVWWTPEWSPVQIPVFPGGGLVGGVLLVNLLFAQFLKLERSRRKAGMWIAHFGVALLFVGEFSTAMFQVESSMPIMVGSTRDYSEDSRRLELAVTDGTDASGDTVTMIPDSYLKPGREITHPSLPFKITVKRWYENSDLAMRKAGDPASEADAGVGTNLTVSETSPVTSDDAQNATAALIGLTADGKSLGTYWVSNALGAPQGFSREGRTWRLALRARRYYLPFSMTLKKFTHEIYPGTDIPRNFASLVRLQDPTHGEDRDALIYMNHPLRYGGKTFYQASFGQNDQLSVLQVVRNPGWLIPYLSCILVALGLLLHFGVKLSASLRSAR